MAPQAHLATLELSVLTLEIFSEPDPVRRAEQLLPQLERLWPHLFSVIQEEGVLGHLEIDPAHQTLEVELSWVGNQTIRQLNKEYRQKDQATDVLTFTLLADSGNPALWRLPVLQLGSIFISVEWAEEEVAKDRSLNLERYLLERFAHGMLHLLGQHHDTMADYERVKSIQTRALDRCLEGV